MKQKYKNAIIASVLLWAILALVNAYIQNVYAVELSNNMLIEDRYTVMTSLYQCETGMIVDLYAQAFDNNDTYWRMIVMDEDVNEIYFFEKWTQGIDEFDSYLHFFQTAGEWYNQC